MRDDFFLYPKSIMYCLYSLQHSQAFLDAVRDSKEEEFKYDINDFSIWKHEDGKCANSECKFIHDRKAFIESIHKDPKYYILSVMLMSINKPQSNISYKVYNPMKKVAFDSKNVKTDFTSALKGKQLYDNADDVRNYAKYNGWYLFNNISNIVNDIMKETSSWGKSYQLMKLFWKVYMSCSETCTIHACTKQDNYCIRFISNPSYCKYKDSCYDSHDIDTMRKDMFENIRLWTKIIGRMICFGVHKHIHNMNYFIPYKSDKMILDCNNFIKKYRILYLRSRNNPLLFKSIINLIFAFEEEHEHIDDTVSDVNNEAHRII